MPQLTRMFDASFFKLERIMEPKDLKRKIKFWKIRSNFHKPTKAFVNKTKYNRKKISKKIIVE